MSALTGGGLLWQKTNGVAEEPVRRLAPIVDTHIHLYDPGRPGAGGWPPKENLVLYSPHLPAQFREATKDLPILGAVVVEAEAEPNDNLWVLDLARKESLILAYIARLTPGSPQFAERLKEYLKSPWFRGLRLRDDMIAAGLGNSAFERDLKLVGKHGLTLDIVGGTAVWESVPQLAAAAPGARFVLDHLPGGDFARATDAWRKAAALPNVFAKVSDVLQRNQSGLTGDPSAYKARLDLLWEVFGEDRVLYGSNWPVSDLVAPYGVVYLTVANYVNARGPGPAEKFFWKNSRAAYQWVSRTVSAKSSAP